MAREPGRGRHNASMITLNDWSPNYRGGALRIVGWCSYDGGATRQHVSTGRVVAVRPYPAARREFSTHDSACGVVEQRLWRGAVARVADRHEYLLGNPAAA